MLCPGFRTALRTTKLRFKVLHSYTSVLSETSFVGTYINTEKYTLHLKLSFDLISVSVNQKFKLHEIETVTVDKHK